MIKKSAEIKEQSLTKGFAVLSIATILVKVLSLLFVPIVRTLMGGSAGYQVYYSASQVYAFVYVIATAGIPVALSKLVAELLTKEQHIKARESFKFALKVIGFIGVFFMVLIMALSKPIANLAGYPESWLGIFVLGPNIFICALLSSYRGYLQGLQNMSPTAISQVVEQIVHTAVAILCAIILRPLGIVWMVAGTSFGTVIGSLVALVIVYKFYRNHEAVASPLTQPGDQTPEKGPLLRLLLHNSFPITLNAAIQYGGTLVDVFLVKEMLITSGLTEYAAKSLHGDLSAARQIINVPSALVTSLCVSLLPIITAAFSRGDGKTTEERANYAFKLCYLVTIPAAVGMSIFAPAIYKVLNFGNNSFIMMFMAFTVIIMGMTHIQSTVMQGTNMLYEAVGFFAIGIAAKCVLNVVLIRIPSLGINGAIISTYISYLIPFIVNSIWIIKKRHIKIHYFRPMVKPIIASAAMVIPAYPAYLLFNWLLGFISGYAGNLIAFAIAVILAVATYVIVLKKLGGLNKYDVDQISPKLSRKLGFK